MSDILDTATSWLSEEDLSYVRDRVPIVYVEAVPVRINHRGEVDRVGLLLTFRPDGSVSRAIVSGRVLYGETIRDALWRHLTKDLGPDLDPQLPVSPSPFTVAEYLPDPDKTGYHDPRQHAVALAYVVPIAGEATPSEDALDFTWLTVAEATSQAAADEMSAGHGRLVRLALAHAGMLR